MNGTVIMGQSDAPAVREARRDRGDVDGTMKRDWHPGAVTTLKILLVLFGLMCVFGQYEVVVWSGDIVAMCPETAPVRWPYAIAAIVGIACLEAVLVPLWRLLTLAGRRDVFRVGALVWVDAIIGCAGAAGVTVLFVLLFGAFARFRYCDSSGVCYDAATGMPAVTLGCLALLLLDAMFILLMIVMRSLLADAIAQRDELEAVI